GVRSGNGVGRAEQARRSYTLSHRDHHPRDRLIGDVSRDFLAGEGRNAASITDLAPPGNRPAERTIWKSARFFADQSGFAPENFTTFAAFWVSSAMSFRNGAGVMGTGTPRSPPSRASSFGSPSTAFTAVLSVSTISGGVPFGATIPYHTTAS